MRLYDRYRAVSAGSGRVPPVAPGDHPVATDAVSDFLQENANHFPALETAAERLLPPGSRFDYTGESRQLRHEGGTDAAAL